MRHANVNVKDHDSHITGFGQHDRVIAFMPEGGKLYCRVDHGWGLGAPTARQVLAVAQRTNGQRYRGWTAVSVENWDNGNCTDWYFSKG